MQHVFPNCLLKLKAEGILKSGIKLRTFGPTTLGEHFP